MQFIQDFSELKINSKLESVTEKLADLYQENNFPHLSIASQNQDLAQIQELADSIKTNFKNAVILGMGGSILNPQAICEIADESDDFNLILQDTIDPNAFDKMLKSIDLGSTCFIAISKSGKTPETLSQVLIIIDQLKRNNLNAIGDRFIFISDPGANPIREIAEQINAKTLDHVSQIGGRFAGLTNVGLLPAALKGLDIAAIRQGAKQVVDEFIKNGAESQVAKAAGFAYDLMQEGTNIFVIMPYVERLKHFILLYRQIWAESLGKKGNGSIPVAATGPQDQHSQLQLYLDGPNDKYYTIIMLEQQGKGKKIPGDLVTNPDLAYLKDITLGDLVVAEQNATYETLIRNDRVVRKITLKEMNEQTIGALIMHVMLETIITAGLLDIDPFDQPAVEQGKILAREYLQKQKPKG